MRTGRLAAGAGLHRQLKNPPLLKRPTAAAAVSVRATAVAAAAAAPSRRKAVRGMWTWKEECAISAELTMAAARSYGLNYYWAEPTVHLIGLFIDME